MTSNPTKYEHIPSYCFRGVASTKCHRWTETITMSLHRGAAGNNEIHQYFCYYKLTLWEALLTYLCFSSIKLICFKYHILAWSTIAKPCNNICFSSSSCFTLFIYNNFNTVKVGLWCLTPLSTIFQLYRGGNQSQTWGQLLSNVIDYITITLQFSWLHYDYINLQM